MNVQSAHHVRNMLCVACEHFLSICSRLLSFRAMLTNHLGHANEPNMQMQGGQQQTIERANRRKTREEEETNERVPTKHPSQREI